MDGTGEYHLKLARLTKPKAACFLLYVEDRLNKMQAILYIHRNTANMHPKLGLVEKTKEGKKDGK
jgi:hypothetical protein